MDVGPHAHPLSLLLTFEWLLWQILKPPAEGCS
jgi:hypothetical protein